MEALKTGLAEVIDDRDAALVDEGAAPLPDDGETDAPGRRRRRRARAKTISIKRMTKEELRLGRLLYPEMDYDKPQTRADCAEGERPCPFVSCKHHLYLDVNPSTGSIKLNFPDLEVWEMPDSCALDIADRGGLTLEEVGEIVNLTRERVRQVEMRGLLKLKHLDDTTQLRDYVEPDPDSDYD